MTWRKSTYSASGGANCVEVGHRVGRVLIRDTKDRGTGPVLTVSPSAWRTFTRSMRTARPLVEPR